MKLTHLRATSFKGRDIDLPLTGAELLIGPNGSGKSAHLEAVMVALLGYLPKLGKTPGATMTLAANGRMDTRLTMVNGLSITRIFFNKKKGGASQEISILDPEYNGIEAITTTQLEEIIAQKTGAFPVMFDPSEFLALTPDKRREWLTPYIPKTEVQPFEAATVAIYRELLGDDVVDAILELTTDKAALHKRSKEKNAQLHDASFLLFKDIDDATTGPDGDDKAVRWLTLLKDRSSAMRQRKRDNQGTVRNLQEELAKHRSMAAGLAELKEECEILSFKLIKAERDLSSSIEKAKAYKRLESEKTKLEERRDAIVFIQEERNVLDSKAKECFAALKVAQDAWMEIEDGDASPKSSVTDARIGAIQMEIDELCLASNMKAGNIKAFREQIEKVPTFKCPNCGFSTEEQNDSNQEMLTGAEAELAGLNQDLADANKRYLEATVALAERLKEITLLEDAADKAEALRVEYDERNGKKAELSDAILKITTEMQTIILIDDDMATMRRNTIKNDLDAKRELLGKKQRAAGMASQIEKSLLAIAQIETEEEALKVVTAAVKTVRNASVNALTKNLTETANRMLQTINPAMSLEVVLERDGKDVFDFVVRIDGKPRSISTLSGGEAVTLGIAISTSLIGLASPPLRVLLVEGAEVDPANLTGLLKGAKALLDAGHLDNVMVASCHLPAETADGWNVVRLG